MTQQRKSTVYVDYQQRAKEFSVGDLAFPIAGGSTDESMAGRVVAVWPAIGQVDLEFAWGSGRYGVEDLQRVTRIVSIPPNPEHTTVPGGVGSVSVSGGPSSSKPRKKEALYWASADRHYQATKAELESGAYTCPKCRQGVLKPTVYKRSEGRSTRLLGCHECLFLIKPCDIIGDPEFDGGNPVQSSQKKAAKDQMVVISFQAEGWTRGGHRMLDEDQTWDDVARAFVRNFKRHLSSPLLTTGFVRAEYRGRGLVEVFIESNVQDEDHILDLFERELEEFQKRPLLDEYNYLIFGPPGSERMPQVQLEVL